MSRNKSSLLSNKYKCASISKNNDNKIITKIKPNELDCIKITQEEECDIIHLCKKNLSPSIISLLIITLCSSISFLELLDSLLVSKSFFNLELSSLFFMVAFVFLLYFTFSIFKEVYYLNTGRNGYYKRAEYGIVSNKYLSKDKVEYSNLNSSTIQVEFPNKSTYLDNVYCDNNIFDKLDIGSQVLVVSLDNNSCHAIIPKKLYYFIPKRLKHK